MLNKIKTVILIKYQTVCLENSFSLLPAFTQRKVIEIHWVERTSMFVLVVLLVQKKIVLNTAHWPEYNRKVSPLHRSVLHNDDGTRTNCRCSDPVTSVWMGMSVLRSFYFYGCCDKTPLTSVCSCIRCPRDWEEFSGFMNSWFIHIKYFSVKKTWLNPLQLNAHY